MNKNNKNGFISVLATILVLSVMLASALSLTNLVVGQIKISSNVVKSSQAYFTAESGIEDAILRIRKGLTVPSSYSLTVGGSSADIQISDPIGGSRTITSNGVNSNKTRKIEVNHNFGGSVIEFSFGAQVGDGGLIMNGSSKVEGNVFSNGSIIGAGGGGQVITGTAQVAGVGNQIDGITVNEDVKVHTCQNSVIDRDLYAHNCNDSTVGGDLYYVAGGSLNNCEPVGLEIEEVPGNVYPDPQSLPISDAQIAEWKADATTCGGICIYAGDYILGGTNIAGIGPAKIVGDLILTNSAVLTLTGIVWVTGNVTLSNTATIQLDDSVFGFASGVLVADGVVNLGNNITIKGTSQDTSYLMLLTTSSADPAMIINNSADAGVFYASNGVIEIANNSFLREVTAYGLRLGNNVTVQYEVGLANSFFSSGPGSGWEVEAWQEVE